MKHGNVSTSGEQSDKRGMTSQTETTSSPAVTGPNGGPVPLAPDERIRLIAEAAYYRGEARGFAPGREIDDWLQAEAEIDRVLAGR